MAGILLRFAKSRMRARCCRVKPSALMLGFSGYPRQIIAPAIARLAQAFG
jgi:glycine/serine hydroxymethyltransferase